MIKATDIQKDALQKNVQQWLLSQEGKTSRVPMRRIVVFVISCFACFFVHEAAFGFSTNECVSHLSKDIDPPYRLSTVQATARCYAIARRIAKLSRQICGKWQRKGHNGQIETMVISSDGTARIHCYDFGTRQMRDVVQKWAFENPYGTLGEESLQFDEGTLSSVKFSGATMTITSQPATATIVERWTRSR